MALGLVELIERQMDYELQMQEQQMHHDEQMLQQAMRDAELQQSIRREQMDNAWRREQRMQEKSDTAHAAQMAELVAFSTRQMEQSALDQGRALEQMRDQAKHQAAAQQKLLEFMMQQKNEVHPSLRNLWGSRILALIGSLRRSVLTIMSCCTSMCRAERTKENGEDEEEPHFNFLGSSIGCRNLLQEFRKLRIWQKREMKQIVQDQQQATKKFEEMCIHLLEVKRKDNKPTLGSMGNPEKARKDQDFIHNEFYVALPRFVLTLESTIPNQCAGKKNVAFLGDVSSGKSALINKLFCPDPPLDEGQGHCTSEVSNVFTSPDSKVIIWDSPGCNHMDFPLYDVKAVTLFHGMSLIVVVYASSVSTVYRILQYVKALHGENGEKIILVRTMIDRFFEKRKLAKSLEQELEADRQSLEELGLTGTKIFCTSAQMDRAGVDIGLLLEKVQNDQLKRHILLQ